MLRFGVRDFTVHARPEVGIGPFEAGNAADSILGMNLGDGTWNVGKGCKERETSYEKKTLSELAHFDSPFVFGLKLGFVSGALGA